MIFTAAKLRGLSLEEMEEMTFGQVVDYIIAYNNMMMPEEEKGVTKATQQHWDNF